MTVGQSKPGQWCHAANQSAGDIWLVWVSFDLNYSSSFFVRRTESPVFFRFSFCLSCVLGLAHTHKSPLPIPLFWAAGRLVSPIGLSNEYDWQLRSGSGPDSCLSIFSGFLPLLFF